MTESSAHRDEYVRKNNPTLEEMLQHYSQSVKDLLKKNTNDGYSRNLLNFESDVTFNGLSKFMEEE
ncbi:hypothetical protein GW864_00030 [bacterium]|nr:hypothetical protein [bacterium]